MHPADERARWLSIHVLGHEPALRAWLYHRRVVGIETDDIIQDTYARLISVESVDEIRNVRSYLFQTAHSVLCSYIRRSKIINLQVVSDMDTLGLAGNEATPEAHAIGHDELRRLGRSIARLPKRIQDVFIARRIHGLSQREAAKALGLSENTIEKYMVRSILLLSRLFLCDGNDGIRASNQAGTKFSNRESRSGKERVRKTD